MPVVTETDLTTLRPRTFLAAEDAYRGVPHAESSGHLIAWCSHETGIRVVELATGRDVAHAPDYPVNQIITEGERFYFYRLNGERIRCIGRNGHDVERPVPGPSWLRSVAPDGARVLLETRESFGVYDWPSMEPVLVRPHTNVYLGALWIEGGYAFDWGPGWIDAWPVDGSPAQRLEGLPTVNAWMELGHGVLGSVGGNTLTVCSPVRGWTTELHRETSEFAAPIPSPTRDGTRVRFVSPIDGLVSVTYDPMTGAMSDRVARKVPRSERHLWHPTLDVTATMGAIASIEGTVLCTLPDDEVPYVWAGDGRALITEQPAANALAGPARLWSLEDP